MTLSKVIESTKFQFMYVYVCLCQFAKIWVMVHAHAEGKRLFVPEHEAIPNAG